MPLPPEKSALYRPPGSHEAQLFNRAGQVAEVTIEGNLARIERVDQNPSPVIFRVAVGFEPSVVKQLIASLSELGVAELSFFKADRSQASSLVCLRKPSRIVLPLKPLGSVSVRALEDQLSLRIAP